MKKLVKRVEIYIAEDGKEFFNMTDCLFYENHDMIEERKKKWINRQYNDFYNNQTAWARGQGIHEVKDFTIVGNFSIYKNIIDGHVVITNLRTGRSGKAVCSNIRFFNHRVGTAIAWARYKGEEIPEYI